MERRIILLVTLFSCSLAATNKPCQKGGAYCLNHWDCCSNTCLSFLYQCSHITSSDIKPVDKPVPVSFSVQSSPVLDSRFDLPELASPPASIAFEPQTVSYESLLELIFNPLKTQQAAVGREINSIVPRIEEVKQAAAVEDESKTEAEVIYTTVKDPSTTRDVPQCLEIGSKCFANEVCCSTRCHGYLHQCVT